jgi:hypothetical protein
MAVADKPPPAPSPKPLRRWHPRIVLANGLRASIPDISGMVMSMVTIQGEAPDYLVVSDKPVLASPTTSNPFFSSTFLMAILIKAASSNNQYACK